MKCFAIGAVVTMAALVGGCGLTATVVDTAQRTTTLHKPELHSGQMLRIRQDGSLLQIALKQVRTVELFVDESMTFDRELYYQGRVELKSGALLDTDRSSSPAKIATYVCVSDVLVGKSGDGMVRIGLESIVKLSLK
jgi:hypothetical protein